MVSVRHSDIGSGSYAGFNCSFYYSCFTSLLLYSSRMGAHAEGSLWASVAHQASRSVVFRFTCVCILPCQQDCVPSDQVRKKTAQRMGLLGPLLTGEVIFPSETGSCYPSSSSLPCGPLNFCGSTFTYSI
jgi:hypothetical protein